MSYKYFDPIFDKFFSKEILDYFLEQQTVGEREPWSFVYVSLNDGVISRHFEVCVERNNHQDTIVIYDLDYCDETDSPAYYVSIQSFIELIEPFVMDRKVTKKIN
jgi:hypothetical protein